MSYRQIEDLLWERGIDVCHETVRYWVGVFGKKFAGSIRRKRQNSHSNWQWHIDEVFVKVKGKLHYLWRAVDGEGEVLDCYVSERRNRKAAVKFLQKVMRKRGIPQKIVTDGLSSYRASLKELGLEKCQEVGRYLNNRCENSHLPFRRREYMMQHFRRVRWLQEFASIQGQVYNFFNHERHLVKRDTYKERRSTALAEWMCLFIG
ncbi:IS6 family transposase [Entomobacter blattae]|uniref:IS6 family transposase n=1 Tax=Entomobacter blattae TaxID=2762277 RepID=UPI00193C728B